VKIPFFLRLPVLWAVGDSSVGSQFSQNGKKSDSHRRVSTYYPLLLLASAVMVVPLVWAARESELACSPSQPPNDYRIACSHDLVLAAGKK
jgi:hypothetical protein